MRKDRRRPTVDETVDEGASSESVINSFQYREKGMQKRQE